MIHARIPRRAEPTLSRLGLGASRFGSFGNPQPLGESIALIAAALDCGITTIDTANIYGQGDSERAIGRALAGGRRGRAFIITKAGRRFSSCGRALAWAKPVLRPLLALRGAGRVVTAQREGYLATDWRPAALRESLAGSLRRLRTDHVDGFLLHGPPAEALADGSLDAALGAIRADGMARHVGVSCGDAATLAAAVAMPAVTLLDVPPALLPALAAHGAAIRRRNIIVTLREVIRGRPDLAPAAALDAALAEPLVDCGLVGTGSMTHLHSAAQRAAGRP